MAGGGEERGLLENTRPAWLGIEICMYGFGLKAALGWNIIRVGGWVGWRISKYTIDQCLTGYTRTMGGMKRESMNISEIANSDSERRLFLIYDLVLYHE